MLKGFVVTLTVILLTTSWSIAADKIPVPSAADQNDARKVVKDLFKEDYAKAKQPNEKLVLAKKLLQQAADTEDDPVGRFVLYREARELAADIGSIDIALNALEATSEQFEIDFRKVAIETLIKVRRAGKAAGNTKHELARLMGLIETAVEEDDFEFASAMAPIAVSVARNVGTDTLKSVNVRNAEIEAIQKAYASVRSARQKLETSPNDADASLTDGKFRCFLKGDWGIGLPLLAKCSNSTLKSLAESDLAEPTESAAQAALGDGWRGFAEKENGLARAQLAMRSKYWYEQSEKSLTGLTASKVKKQLEELNSFLKGTSLAGAHPPVISTSGKDGSLFAISPFDGMRAKKLQQAWATRLKQPAAFKNSIGMQLRLIPPGEFLMGSPETEVGRGDERQQKVRIPKPFFMGIYEVTQAQYAQVTAQHPSNFKGDTLPVEQVSWHDAIGFCRKLSDSPQEKAEGRAYRLPTSEEWEYACRAGTLTAYNFGDDTGQLIEAGWVAANSAGKTHPVGEKIPNGWGLFDMHGNVWEWCDTPVSNMKVSRGGSWFPDNGAIARSAYINGDNENARRNYWGFRVVCTVGTQNE